MTTLGRIFVTVLVAGVLIALTVVAVHYLRPSGEVKPALPPGPAMIETPTTDVALGPRDKRPTEAEEGEEPGPGEGEAVRVAEGPGPSAKAPGGPPVTPPVAPGAGAAAADEGLAMVRDRPVEAQKRLSQALRAGVDGPKGREVREALGRLADALQFSSTARRDDAYSKTYKVASGDSLTSIGQRHLIPFELVMRLNRLGSTSIMAGQDLKVIQGPIHLEVHKGRRELQAWLGDVCVRVCPVGIGAENRTPEGTFVVKSKLRNPPYQPQHKPKSEFREAGAPNNPLGTRWIDIGNHYGLHGTIDPSSIGQAVSEGCIRMLNKDVEELFDLVVPGATKVTLRP